jgi:hypothetical protein
MIFPLAWMAGPHDRSRCFSFSLQFCEVGGLAINAPREDLAKFGYKSERKVFFYYLKAIYI